MAALATPTVDAVDASQSGPALHRSVTRALLALELVAESSNPLPLSTLAARLKAPKSSLHPLLKALLARRYLEVDKEANYRLGIRAAELGAAYLNRITPLKGVHPELIVLSRELNMTAHFAIVDGTDALESYAAFKRAVEYCRARKGPALIRGKVIRPYSHSLSDDEKLYRPDEERQADAAVDPIKTYAEFLINERIASADDLDTANGHLVKEVEQLLGQGYTYYHDVLRQLADSTVRVSVIPCRFLNPSK